MMPALVSAAKLLSCSAFTTAPRICSFVAVERSTLVRRTFSVVPVFFADAVALAIPGLLGSPSPRGVILLQSYQLFSPYVFDRFCGRLKVCVSPPATLTASQKQQG